MNRRLSIFIFLSICIFTQIGIAWAAITLMVVSPKNVNMGSVKAADYESGYKEKIRANALLVRDTVNDWKLMVKTNDENMGSIGDYTKPIGDLNWRTQGIYATQLTYTNLTNYDIEAARGPKTSSLNLIYIDYKILLAWAKDVPGIYNITIIYTLTTQ